MTSVRLEIVKCVVWKAAVAGVATPYFMLRHIVCQGLNYSTSLLSIWTCFVSSNMFLCPYIIYYLRRRRVRTFMATWLMHTLWIFPCICQHFTCTLNSIQCARVIKLFNICILVYISRFKWTVNLLLIGKLFTIKKWLDVPF